MPDRMPSLPRLLPRFGNNREEQLWYQAVEQLRQSDPAPGRWQTDLNTLLDIGKKHFPDRLQQEIRHLMHINGGGTLIRKVIDNLHYTAPNLLDPLIGELLPRTRPALTPDAADRRWLWDRLYDHISSTEAFPWVCAAAETETHPSVLEVVGRWGPLLNHQQRLTLDAILSRRLHALPSPEQAENDKTELALWELRLRSNYGTLHNPLVEDITRRIQTAPIPLAGRLISLAQYHQLTTGRYLTDHLTDTLLERGDPVHTRTGELFARLAAPPCPPGYLEYRLIDRCRRGEIAPSPNVLRWIGWLLDHRRIDSGSPHLMPPLPPGQWEELHQRAAPLFSPPMPPVDISQAAPDVVPNMDVPHRTAPGRRSSDTGWTR